MAAIKRTKEPLLVTHPELAKEWNYDKNAPLSPDKVSSGSHKKVWWSCPQGHDWEALISNRAKGNACPYCSGQWVIVGKTDLATVKPELAEEWNYDKNGSLKPTDVTVGSGKKVWWKCVSGHEWQAATYSRSTGNGCPYCSNKAILIGFNDLATTNGSLTKEWNYEKNAPLLPNEVTSGSHKKVWWKCDNGHEWKAAINSRAAGSGCPYCSGLNSVVGKTDLATLKPELAKEWNYEKNYPLTPKMFSAGSGKKVWWNCVCGHEWQAAIYTRSTGNGCPYCSNKAVLVGFNDLATTHSSLTEEWNYEKNAPLLPSQITAGAGKKVWWKCAKGHEWEATINSRTTSGSGCPYCSGRYTVVGETDLATLKPELANEWDYEKNYPLTPTMFSSGSSKLVWWKCVKGHEWEAKIVNRSKGHGCPYCSNQKVLVGFNDLGTTSPELALEWNYEKNAGLTNKFGVDISQPENLTNNSIQVVWWRCSKGHEWQASPNNRSGGKGCPYCSGKRAIKGETDLVTSFPKLIEEWDFEKNTDISPDSVTAYSNKRVWWKCSEGHEWQAVIGSRSAGNNCPYCAGQRIIIGKNDLFSLDPVLSEEWNYEKNGNLTPRDITLRSNKSVWWKCVYGHEWQTSPYNRSNGDGCPFCSGAGTSFAEQGIAYYLSKACKVESRAKIAGKEIDVYLPEYLIGIEYDGIWFHTGKEKKEFEKDRVLNENGIFLIRVKEADNNVVVSDKLINYHYDGMKDNYEWALRELCGKLALFTGNDAFLSIDICVKRDRTKIRERIKTNILEKNLLVKFPQLCHEWNYDKNGILIPEMFSPGSSEKVWWKCSEGHEWEASISHRTSRKDGCPFCSERRIIRGKNDLLSTNPVLVNEWDYDKNNPLTPYKVRMGSGIKVWWKCSKCKYTWQALISNRALLGNGCPKCGEKQRCSTRIKNMCETRGSLLDVYPQLAEEWNYQKNSGLNPNEVTSKSNRKVWWKCSKGHEWEATIGSRARGNSCPVCSGRQVLSGFNDLATIKPELINEWNYEKNSGLTPCEVTVGSGKKVWWKCAAGHEWQTEIYHRTSGKGCPYCSGLKHSRILCVETGNIYTTLTEAYKDTGVNITSIGQCCRGKQNIAGGYHWKYIDE